MAGYYCLRHDFLEFTGNDRLDLINRLSTNALNLLSENKVLNTILTNDKGRFVDLVTILNSSQRVICMCSYKNSVNITAHLDRYTIMDDFAWKNISGLYTSFLITGKDIDNYISELFKIHTDSFNTGDFVTSSENEIIFRNDNTIGGYIIICPAHLQNELSMKFSVACMTNISDLEYETMRIEHGIPSFGREINENTNPLECGLKKYISFTKGCYIGQEVIARLDSYDKISKHMVGISSDKYFTVKEPGEIKILKDGIACGYVTSSALSKEFGPIGLGFIKTQYIDYSIDYSIIYEDLNIKCKLTKLPFITNHQ